MENNEIKKIPTGIDNLHQNSFRSTHILWQVLNMIDSVCSKNVFRIKTHELLHQHHHKNLT